MLKTTAISAVFYTAYLLLLKRETFHGFNRLYLVASIIFAYLLPLIKIRIEQPTPDRLHLFSVLHEATNIFQFNEELVAPIETSKQWNAGQLLWAIYLTICALLLVRFIVHLLLINIQTLKHETIKKSRFTLVLTNDQTSFSFFRYIFIAKNVMQTKEADSIIAHEASHVSKLHSIDKIFMELLTVFFWPNPVLFLVKKSLEEIHEFQADREVTQTQGSVHSYFRILLEQTFNHRFSPLISHFSYKLIKKRIIMSTKHSNPIKKAWVIIPVTIAAFLFCSTSLRFANGQVNATAPLSDAKQLPVNNTDSLASRPFLYPIEKSKVTRPMVGWGYRTHPKYGIKKLHEAMDFAADAETPVMAIGDGVVRELINHKTGYGKHLVVDHTNGYSSLYAHLNGFNVAAGQHVKQGEVIAFVGNTGMSTGTHLHLEVMKNGKKLDPEPLLR